MILVRELALVRQLEGLDEDAVSGTTPARVRALALVPTSNILLDSQDRYLLNLQLVQNAVDWSVEDQDLLTIRSRGTYARLLKPMDKSQESMWEGLNYAVALSALIALGVVWNIRQRSEKPMPLIETSDV